MSFAQREVLINDLRDKLSNVRADLKDLTGERADYCVINIRCDNNHNERRIRSGIPIRKELNSIVIQQLKVRERILQEQIVQVKLNDSKYCFDRYHVESLFEEYIKKHGHK